MCVESEVAISISVRIFFKLFTFIFHFFLFRSEALNVATNEGVYELTVYWLFGQTFHYLMTFHSIRRFH